MQESAYTTNICSSWTESTINSIMKLYLENLNEHLDSKGYVFIPGHKYHELLLYFGASIEDLTKVESGYIHQLVNKDREESMSFRQVAFHRMLLEDEEDQGDSRGIALHSDSTLLKSDQTEATNLFVSEKNSDIKRSAKVSPANREAVSQIIDEEICSDSRVKISFKRSGTRVYNLPPPEYVVSTLPEAMAKLHDYFQPASHQHQSNLNQNSKTTIDDQVLIRINKDDENAEPTPEGIHQDGTEISSITLVGRKNVLKGRGGESRIWNLKQPGGNYDSDKFGEMKNDNQTSPVHHDFAWNNCLFDYALESPWETIIFNDRKVKHEARSFFRDEENVPCYRDVIVNFVRKPLLDGSDTKLVNGIKEETIV